LPDENGRSRRERNEDFDTPSPSLNIRDEWRYLWDWYIELAGSVGRIRDGVCHPVPWSEYIGWATVTGLIVWPGEYAILRKMDAAYCAALNSEFEDYRARVKAQQDQGGKNG
jgi:hypothetical protein